MRPCSSITALRSVSTCVSWRWDPAPHLLLELQHLRRARRASWRRTRWRAHRRRAGRRCRRAAAIPAAVLLLRDLEDLRLVGRGKLQREAVVAFVDLGGLRIRVHQIQPGSRRCTTTSLRGSFNAPFTRYVVVGRNMRDERSMPLTIVPLANRCDQVGSRSIVIFSSKRIRQQPRLAGRERRQARVADIGDVIGLVAFVERQDAGRRSALAVAGESDRGQWIAPPVSA